MIQKIKNFKNTPVIMFGVSLEGLAVNTKLKKSNVKLHCFIDNNKDLHGTYKDDILINSPEYLLSLDNYYVIIPSCHYDDMKKQLVDMGIDKSKIWKVERFNKEFNEIDIPLKLKFYMFLHKLKNN